MRARLCVHGCAQRRVRARRRLSKAAPTRPRACANVRCVLCACVCVCVLCVCACSVCMCVHGCVSKVPRPDLLCEVLVAVLDRSRLEHDVQEVRLLSLDLPARNETAGG